MRFYIEIMKNIVFSVFLLTFLCSFLHGQVDNAILSKRLNSLQTTVSLPYNEVVENCIQKMLRENRSGTQKLLESFLPYQAFFQEELLKADLPQEFASLPLVLQKIQQENNGAFYTAGAWNLPILVAVKYGLTVNNQIDERFCVKKSTAAAIAYLQDISKRTKNEWETIIAYSNSLSALEAAKIRANSNDIWTLYQSGNLPNKNCIPYFIAYTYIAHFYDSEQLKVNPANTGEKRVTIRVEKELVLQNFTTHLSIDESKFRAANPIFIGDVLLPNYDIQIPAEKYDLFAQNEKSIYLYNDTVKKATDSSEKKTAIPIPQTHLQAVPQTTSPKYHTVVSGDMLGRIAQKYGVTVEQLKTWNNLSNDIIQIGQRLVVSKNTSPIPSITPANKPPVSTEKKVVYTVKQGDTLSAIARKHNVSVNDIKKWNNLKNDNIGIDQKLVILK